jgi:hypothetical protein
MFQILSIPSLTIAGFLAGAATLMIASRLRRKAPSKIQSESEQGGFGLTGSTGAGLSLAMKPLLDRIAREDINFIVLDSLDELPASRDVWE